MNAFMDYNKDVTHKEIIRLPTVTHDKGGLNIRQRKLFIE